MRIEKNEAALWRGLPIAPSAPRRHASAIQRSLASSQVQASSSSDSNATFVEQPLLAIQDSVGFDKRRRYKEITAGALQHATSFLIENVRDLDLGNISPTKLAVWLYVIAKGRSVVAQESEQRKQFVRAIGLVAAKLHFTETFRTKNAQTFRLFMSLLQSEAANCKWKSIAEPQKDAWLIDGLQDMRSFLLNVQRVPSGSPSGPPSSKKRQRANPPRSI